MIAEIVRGKNSNRVRVRRDNTLRSPNEARRRWARDEALGALVKGKRAPIVSTCVSMPVGDMLTMDAAAERLGIARSALIRRAVRYCLDNNIKLG